LRIAAGHHDDDIGAVDGRPQIGCRALDGGKSGLPAFDFDAAKYPDVGKPLIVDVVQAQFEPGDPELCREINPANAGADDCHRLDRVSIRHDRLLRPLYEPAG